MEFRIADTFTSSLAKLTNDEQKAVKTTAFDLQTNPSQPGLHFHRVDRGRDSNFWSVRAGRDIRIILHQTTNSLLLCYVDHHDDAYGWAEHRKLETHPTTGAAQMVEIRETVQEIMIPVLLETERERPPKPLLFAVYNDADLLKYGVPEDWLPDVRLANEDSLLDLADHLPTEAAEALLELAVGKTPELAVPAVAAHDPFDHPDARRRFRTMRDVEELEQALDAPWETWAVFLHPAQRQLVERDYNGPARVSGTAGTGKTVVALHRAVRLATGNPDARVLLTTFSDALANSLRAKLRLLLGNQPMVAERLEVHSLDAVGARLYERNLGPLNIASLQNIRDLLDQAVSETGEQRFPLRFLLADWQQVVDARHLDTWDAYRDVTRLGRRRRLSETQRSALWAIFQQLWNALETAGVVTRSSMFHQLATLFSGRERRPFDFVVVDEAQDVSIAQLRFLAALAGDRPNGLFFAGDLGQRIFQQPFSWRELGVDVRGRSRTLRVNYRTSHQIRAQADLLLDPEISDVDGNTEERGGTVSVFNGPRPIVRVLPNVEEEGRRVHEWLSSRVNEGIQPEEISLFVRSEDQLERATSVVNSAGLLPKVLDEHVETIPGNVSVSTMHLAKGLEFRAVAVMACDDELIPSQERVEAITDESELEEVYNSERNLLYVACTRARDHLLVTGVEPASEFLDDLRM